jgi:hypothetical protein
MTIHIIIFTYKHMITLAIQSDGDLNLILSAQSSFLSLFGCFSQYLLNNSPFSSSINSLMSLSLSLSPARGPDFGTDTVDGEGFGVLLEVSVLWGLDRGRESRTSNALSMLPYRWIIRGMG